jgi:Cu/Ag efflux pump CusA
MRPSAKLLPLLAMLAVVWGCGCSQQRIIRVTVQDPGKSPRYVADALANAIEMKVLGLPHIESFTSISSDGSLETYIVVAQDGDPQEAVGRIEAAFLTADPLLGDAVPTVELLPKTATIPAVTPTEIDCVVVELKRREIARHGIRIRDVFSAMQEQAGGSASDIARLEKLRAVQVIDLDKQRVPLTELADIRIEKQPSHIVTRWPSE